MEKLNHLFVRICELLIIVMITVMALAVFIQVVLRYLFLSPFSWVEELVRYLLVWISCLGAAYGLKKGMHISVLFINKKFSENAKYLVNLVIHFMQIAFFAICFIKGLSLSFIIWDQKSPALQISMAWAYLAVPVGFGLLIMFSLEFLTENLKKIFSRNGAY